MLNKLNIFGKKKTDTTHVTDTTGKKTTVAPGEVEKKGFIGGLKDKAVEKMLEKQLAQVPPAQREMLMNAIKKNPEFFERIAKKIKEEEKRNGGNQMAASMKVMRENQGELMKVMSQK